MSDDGAPSIDLDKYLERLEWGGGTAPTFETLRGLLLAHMSAIPFENLDVLLGRPVRIDLASIQAKLVQNRRGGYCFEHAALFAAAIEALGFHPVRHSARVVLFTPLAQSPRGHMVLTVALPEGRFVLDPGFGGPSATFPIPLVDGEAPPDVALTHAMVREADYWVLRIRTGERTSDAWATTLEQDYPADYEMANHFISTHPASPFVNNILMNALTPTGRIGIMNRDVTIEDGDMRRSLVLGDRAALRAMVNEHFGFDLPEIERLRVPAIPEWT